MWLIKTSSLALEAVIDPEGHEYAILSHTWEDGETCRLAHEQGIEYAWVDTCCIDKSSSAELTEAINSMFRWYKMAKVCIVLLSDLHDKQDLHEALARCRWFTRGWTLQELIAPTNINFYDQSWRLRGTKETLLPQLVEITGIDEVVLRDSESITTVCLARRMSWAARRKTTREEDLAYCLFGVFDVNLPLIYGEGSKAFIRLQEAIAADNNDLSLLAWTSAQENSQALRGIFAYDPSEFLECSNVHRDADPAFQTPEFNFTNKGFHITTSLTQSSRAEDYEMNLQCHVAAGGWQYKPRPIFIRLLKTAQGYVRYQTNQMFTASELYTTNLQTSKAVQVYIPKTLRRIESELLEKALTHRFALAIENTSNCLCIVKKLPQHLWDESAEAFITEAHERFTALLKIHVIPWGDSAPPTKDVDTLEDSDLGSRYVGIFGLNSQLKPESGLFSEHLEPWAAIYKHDRQGTVSEIVAHEEQSKSSRVPNPATRISEALRSHSSDGRVLPLSLWLATGRVEGYWRTDGHFLYDGQVKLSLSVTRQLDGFSKYKAILKIEPIVEAGRSLSSH